MISVSQDEASTFLDGSQDHRSRAPCGIRMSKALHTMLSCFKRTTRYFGPTLLVIT